MKVYTSYKYTQQANSLRSEQTKGQHSLQQLPYSVEVRTSGFFHWQTAKQQRHRQLCSAYRGKPHCHPRIWCLYYWHSWEHSLGQAWTYQPGTNWLHLCQFRNESCHRNNHWWHRSRSLTRINRGCQPVTMVGLWWSLTQGTSRCWMCHCSCYPQRRLQCTRFQTTKARTSCLAWWRDQCSHLCRCRIRLPYTVH